MNKLELGEKIREELIYCYNEGQFSTEPNYRWGKAPIIEHALKKIQALIFGETVTDNIVKEGYNGVA